MLWKIESESGMQCVFVDGMDVHHVAFLVASFVDVAVAVAVYIAGFETNKIIWMDI